MENIGLIYRKKDAFSRLDSGNDLLEPKLKKKIRIGVLSVHFGVLAIFVLWYLIANFFIAKKPTVIKVILVSPDTASAILPSPPTPVRAQATPTPPVIKPKHRPKQKTPPKPKPKARTKTKPKWKPRTANDIKISKTIIRNDPIPTPVRPMLSAKDIEKNLRNSYRNSRVKTTTTRRTTQGGAKISQNYFEKISALMYQSWQQPSQSELYGKYPVVDVEITVNSSGRIVKSRIARKSGSSVMDQSVERLLRKIRTLPPPPSGKTTFTVSLEIVRE